MNNNQQVKDTSVQDMLKGSGARKRRSGWLGWLFFLLVLGMGGYAGWYYYQQQQQVAAIPDYVTETLKTGNLSTSVTATGNLQPLNQVDIGTELSGTVKAVLVEQNASVSKGQELASLNTEQLEDAITKARAALITAKSRVAQAEAQIVQSQAKVKQANVNVQQAIASAEQSATSAEQSAANARQSLATVSQSSNGVAQSELGVRQSNASVQQGLANIEQAKAQVEQAKASTLDARLKLNSLQQLYKESGGKLPARTDLDAAVTTWKKALAAETSVQASLSAAQAGLVSTRTGVDVAKNSFTASKTSVTAARLSAEAARLGAAAAKINAASARANIEGVKASVDAARADEASARANLDAARAGVMDAEANLRSAETNLTKATIRSPIDGVVLTRSVEAGQTVASSLSAPTLFTLAEDLAKMELLVGVDEADVGQVKDGQQAEFTVDAWPGRKFPAQISRVSLGSTLSDNVVTYQAVLSVENQDLSLRPGMTATASIITHERQNVLLVPSAALRFNPPRPEGAPAGSAPAGGSAAPAAQNESFLSKLMPRPPMRSRQQPGNRGGSRPGGRSGGGQRDPGQGRIWVLDNGEPRRIRVTVGISDGKLTEVSADELQEGMAVITEIRAVTP